MSYSTIIDKVVEINKTISGINQSLDYEPAGQTLINSPCIYAKFETMNVTPEPCVEANEYDIKLIVLIRYTDAEEAERLVKSLIDNVKATYRDSVKLDGVLVNGSARISGGEGKYVLISDIIYRVIEFNLRVYDKETVTFSE
jgi:hypothetical protein